MPRSASAAPTSSRCSSGSARGRLSRQTIRVDQGTRVRLRAISTCGPIMRGVTLDFSRPASRRTTPSSSALNGKFRAECLNAHWFMSLDDAREKWRLGVETTTRLRAVRRPSALFEGGGKACLAPTFRSALISRGGGPRRGSVSQHRVTAALRPIRPRRRMGAAIPRLLDYLFNARQNWVSYSEYRLLTLGADGTFKCAKPCVAPIASNNKTK